jgi:hypothetical protein
MEVVYSSEKSVIVYQTARFHISEDANLHILRTENLVCRQRPVHETFSDVTQ